MLLPALRRRRIRPSCSRWAAHNWKRCAMFASSSALAMATRVRAHEPRNAQHLQQTQRGAREMFVMAQIEEKIATLGLVLPPAVVAPPGVLLPFQLVRIAGRRAFISGHPPQASDGSLAKPLGKVGRDLTVAQGYVAARLTALSILGSLQRALGDLDRIAAWTRVFGMVNSAPGFNQQPSVINGFSDLLLELFGPDIGPQRLSAVGMAERPFDIPVEIEGEVELRA